ncbi:MAG: putative NAD-dependent epimerase/dehydratase [Bacteroidetes bacterium]|nr:putative NAD-dependent epimerase/dehydratase [Bacteroidota bacterium]
MRILILGASGQVGIAVYKGISEEHPGAEVIAVLRKPDPKFKKNILFDPFKDDWSALGKADVVVNCIGIIQQTKETDFEKAHVGLVKLMLENRSKIGDPRIINVSVLGAGKKLNSPFLDTKKVADDLLLPEPDTYIIRPSIVCTHNTVIVRKFRMLKKMSRIGLGLLPFPSGFLKSNIQPVMGEDVAAVISKLCVAADDNRIFILSGPEVFSIRTLLKGMDGRITFIPIPQGMFNFLFGILSRLAPKLLNIEEFTLLQTDNVGDNKESERILGRAMQSTKNFWKEELK